MTEDKATSNRDRQKLPDQKAVGSDYYTLLELHPSASVQEIRQAYREMSKLYHPDTTRLPFAIATHKFQQLNEAYATLSNFDRRNAYDLKIGYSRVTVMKPLPALNRPQPTYTDSAYLDATDRPLSAGEIFALFILGVTFVACLVLAVTIGVTRGEAAFRPITARGSVVLEVAHPSSETVTAEISPEQPPLSAPEISATLKSTD